MKSGDDDRGTRRTYKTRELLPVPIRLVPLCCYSSLPCVYGLIFHNRTGNRATNHFYFSSSFFPLIHQFPSIGVESGRVIGRDEINFTPLFVPRLPTTNCVLYFLARVFDLISDDPGPPFLEFSRTNEAYIQLDGSGFVYLSIRCVYIFEAGVMKSIEKKEKKEKKKVGERSRGKREGRSGCTGGDVSRFLSPAFEIVSGSIYEPFNREIVI